MSRLSDKIITGTVGTLPANGVTESITVVAAADNSSDAMVAGVVYDIVCTEDCYICSSASASADDATTSDYFLPANVIISVTAATGLLYVSAIRRTTDGVLTISPRVTSNA